MGLEISSVRAIEMSFSHEETLVGASLQFLSGPSREAITSYLINSTNEDIIIYLKLTYNPFHWSTSSFGKTNVPFLQHA